MDTAVAASWKFKLQSSSVQSSNLNFKHRFTFPGVNRRAWRLFCGWNSSSLSRILRDDTSSLILKTNSDRERLLFLTDWSVESFEFFADSIRQLIFTSVVIKLIGALGITWHCELAGFSTPNSVSLLIERADRSSLSRSAPVGHQVGGCFATMPYIYSVEEIIKLCQLAD